MLKVVEMNYVASKKNGNGSCPMGMTYPFDLIFDQIADPNLSN